MHVIILAGGVGSRLGGVSKAEVRVNGTRLIDALLATLPTHVSVSIVTPYPIELGTYAQTIRCVCEDPPFGGPAAGISAGLNPDAETTAVLAVDAPASGTLLEALTNALATNPGADAAAIMSTQGHLEPLCIVWRTASLVAAFDQLGDPRDKPAKALLRIAGSVVPVPGTGAEVDYDTVAELSELGAVELPAPPPPATQ